jgi:hypothetical protein
MYGLGNHDSSCHVILLGVRCNPKQIDLISRTLMNARLTDNDVGNIREIVEITTAFHCQLRRLERIGGPDVRAIMQMTSRHEPHD